MELRHLGHEMAVSSVTDDKNLYLKNSSAWTDELAGMRRIMELQVGSIDSSSYLVPQWQ